LLGPLFCAICVILGKKKINQLKACWNEQRSIREVMVFLRAHGASPGYAQKIYKQYGDESIAKVKENPYQLAKEVFGINVFRVNLEGDYSKTSKILDIVESNSPGLIVCRTPVVRENIEILESRGYQLMGTQIFYVLSKNLEKINLPEDFEIKEGINIDVVADYITEMIDSALIYLSL